MKTFITTAAVLIALTASFAAHAAQPVVDVTPKTTQIAQAVSRIAGSILDSNQKTAPLPSSFKLPVDASAAVTALAMEPGDPEDIRGLCIAKPDEADTCGAYIQSEAKTQACTFDPHNGQAASFLKQGFFCHGATEPKWVHAPHVAFCDVRDVELNACIAKYAQFLVNHPDPARQTFQFKVRASDGTISTVTVLATAKQNEGDAEKMAVDGANGATVLGRL
jgi:hypothetical protein